MGASGKAACREMIREKQRGLAHLGNSLRIPSPVSVAYTAPALIWFATRPALPRSADITVEARPGHRTGLCETQADIIFEAEISRAAFGAEIQEQSEPRFFVRLRYSRGRGISRAGSAVTVTASDRFRSSLRGRDSRAVGTTILCQAQIFERQRFQERAAGSWP